jgi:molecular chaperone HtpG/TNF receptor-associated protein 1
MFLKPECANYSKKADVEKTVQRYSNFISFPIVLNNEKLNIV